MANLQVGDRVLITFNTIAFNQRLMNMFVYGCSSLTGPATQQAAFAALHTALTAGGGLVPLFRACMTDQFEVTSVWYQIISPSRYAKYTKTTGLGLGTITTENAFSANQAAVILRRGDLGIRSNVSTLHVPLGQSSGCQANGGIGSTVETPLNNLAAALPTQITTAGVVATWDPVINHGPNAAQFTPITDAALMPYVRVMRRRTVGLGI